MGVRAPGGTVGGEYAFWVGDKGIKTRMNLPRDPDREDPLNPLHDAAPDSVAGKQALDPAYRAAMPTDPATDSNRLARTESFPLIMPLAFRADPLGWSRARHDLTLWSRRVLSDAKRDGFAGPSQVLSPAEVLQSACPVSWATFPGRRPGQESDAPLVLKVRTGGREDIQVKTSSSPDQIEVWCAGPVYPFRCSMHRRQGRRPHKDSGI